MVVLSSSWSICLSTWLDTKTTIFPVSRLEISYKSFIDRSMTLYHKPSSYYIGSKYISSSSRFYLPSPHPHPAFTSYLPFPIPSRSRFYLLPPPPTSTRWICLGCQYTQTASIYPKKEEKLQLESTFSGLAIEHWLNMELHVAIAR